MSSIIKLIYGSEIKREIDEGKYLKATDATRLSATADQIFREKGWKKGLFESSKKSAIKSVLKEMLPQQKALDLPRLLQQAEGLMHKHEMKFPLKPHEIDQVCNELREKFPGYTTLEISYLLRNYSATKARLAKAGIIKESNFQTIQIEKGNVKAKIKTYKDVRSDIYTNRKQNEQTFQGFAKVLAKKLSVSEKEINEMIYRSVFNKNPENDREMLKALKYADPDQRLQGYKKLEKFAHLIEVTRSINQQEGTAIHAISIGQFQQLNNDKKSAYNKNHEVYSHFLTQFLCLAGSEFPFLSPSLVKKLESELQDYLGAQSQFKKLLATYFTDHTRFNINLKNFALKTTAPHLQNYTNFQELIPYFDQISTESAEKILKFLNNLEGEDIKNLSFTEAQHLLFLFQYATTLSGKQQIINSDHINWRVIEKFLPATRNLQELAIDKAIIKKLLELKQTSLSIEVFANLMLRVYLSLEKRPVPKTISNQLEIDRQSLSQEVSFVSFGLPSLDVNYHLFQDFHRNGLIEIQLPDTNNLITIPHTITTAETNLRRNEHPQIQLLAGALNKFAKGDAKLFGILQTLCRQAMLNEIADSTRAIDFNQMLGLPEHDPTLVRLQQGFEPTSKSFKYISENEIEISYIAKLSFIDKEAEAEKIDATSEIVNKIVKEFDIKIKLTLIKSNETNEWVILPLRCSTAFEANEKITSALQQELQKLNVEDILELIRLREQDQVKEYDAKFRKMGSSFSKLHDAYMEKIAKKVEDSAERIFADFELTALRMIRRDMLSLQAMTQPSEYFNSQFDSLIGQDLSFVQ